MLTANSTFAGGFDKTKLRIWLAAHGDTPRYIDNVKVYRLK